MASLLLQDIEIETLGLTLESGGPILPSVQMARQTQPAPGRFGVFEGPNPTVGARVIRFVSAAELASAAARLALIDTLSDLLMTGPVEVRDRDSVGRAIRGKARVFEGSVPSPAFVNLDLRVVVEIECANAARWDTESQSRVISATPTAIPVGTLPHGGRFYLSGSAAGALSTTTTIRGRSFNGEVFGELTLLPALASGEHAIIDFDTEEIVHVSTTNVQTPVDDWITGGDYFSFAPRYAVRASGIYSTLEVTAGAGLYAWRRNWVG